MSTETLLAPGVRRPIASAAGRPPIGRIALTGAQAESQQPGAGPPTSSPQAPSGGDGTTTAPSSPAPSGPPPGGDLWGTLILFGGMFLLLWLFLLGPERRKRKQHEQPWLAEARQPQMHVVAVAAAPVEGRANRELVEELGRFLGIPKRQIRVLRGERGRNKQVAIENFARERLLALLGLVD